MERPPFLKRLRPRWAWISLALGLPWLVLPFVQGAAGCALVVSALCFWVGLLGLLFAGSLWLWRKLLFRVSRRLWVILLMLSFMPAFLLTVLFVSLGWVALGGQMSRTLQANLRVAEVALRRASEEPSDKYAMGSVRWLGDVVTVRVKTLPPGIKPGQVGLVWNDGNPLVGRGVFMRAVSQEADGYRLLNLSMSTLAEQSKELWGGELHFRLDRMSGPGPQIIRGGQSAKAGPREGETFATSGKPPLLSWSQGTGLKGSWFFHPFQLPEIGLSIQDWSTGRQDLVLTVRPETSLEELWKGYGFKDAQDGLGEKGNRSWKTLVIQFVIVLMLILGAMVQFVALVMGLHLALQLGRNVDDLFAGVNRLAGGDFSTRIKPRTKDQMGRLALAFNGLAEALGVGQEERRKRQALEEELRVAREVQMHLLPDIPLLPSGAVVQATLLPAREVAGDYYDLFRLADGRLAFLIADVSGKGTSAAFYAAETKGVVAALNKVKRGPREVVDRLNEIWCASHSKRLFMTLIYGVFDPKDGTFQLVRAGHPPARLRRADGRVERLNSRGLGIGMLGEGFIDHLEICEGRLEMGDSLFCFTDGLDEALGADGERFGDARIEAVLAEPGPDPQARMLTAVAAFTEGIPMEDDLTLLVINRG